MSEQEKEKAISIDDLRADIEERSGVALGDVPIGTTYYWFPFDPSAEESKLREPKVFEIGKPVPLKAGVGLVVYALYQDESEVRVYAIMPQETQAKPVPPHRFTLSKATPTVFTEMLSLDVFVEEIADEQVALLGDVGVEEEKVQQPAPQPSPQLAPSLTP